MVASVDIVVTTKPSIKAALIKYFIGSPLGYEVIICMLVVLVKHKVLVGRSGLFC